MTSDASGAASPNKRFYYFGDGQAEGHGKMKDLLGGKGAGLAEMTNAGIPVPPGFTIVTSICNEYSAHGKLNAGFDDEMFSYLARVEKSVGCKFGDVNNPLLVSVRSGAKFSMPGMMDTILNLGLNDETIHGLATRSSDLRFALDSYRRFIQMFADVVMGVPKRSFEEIIEKIKEHAGIKTDVELTVEHLQKLITLYKEHIHTVKGRSFPQDVHEQLIMARNAVFESWNNERAIHYRRMNSIPDELGTAVNIQAMVFGNLPQRSGTGVGFTRDPGTGERAPFGDYLMNAQGEDVVAGIRTGNPISHLAKEMPEVYDQLTTITTRLEKHYKAVQDFEFTIQEGKLYMLQTRNGKLNGRAAVRIAVEMVEEGLITKNEAILSVDPNMVNALLHPVVDPKAAVNVLAKGIGLPGGVVGQIVFSAADAVAWVKNGKKVILVRRETSPDDIKGMEAAEGILTAIGGATSHAAVVGRGMGKCCIVGCSAAEIKEEEKTLTIAGTVLREGDIISLNGFTGEVILGRAPLVEPTISGHFQTLMGWVDSIRRLKVRTNAETPRDAKKAREFGAEGIGLCRTEHMFFDNTRIPVVQKMILAESDEEKQAFIDQLLPMQTRDFIEIFEAMDGYPVTIRTLDPPLHEFLPSQEALKVKIAELKMGNLDAARVEKAIAELKVTDLVPSDKKSPEAILQLLEDLLTRVEQLHEFNPMLGHRGCRLGITFPAVTRMQAQAIMTAAVDVAKRGIKVFPEIMIPLVGHVKELANQKALVRKACEEILEASGIKVPYLIGTMIEVPRAALVAAEIATEAEFFSYGTNDLTQMTFGFSRDDYNKFLPEYIRLGIFAKDVFDTLDQEGVGQLVKMGIERGRSTRPDLKVGICGEHGGEPSSVIFCHKVGMNYVSCSPFRVPIAKMAAAHAVLLETHEQGTGQK